MAKQAMDKLKVFVSYARTDTAVADDLVTELEVRGFEVLIDRRDLPYGEEWQTELSDFIKLCDAVVWLVSPASVTSHWVNWELGEITRLNKRLVPVSAIQVSHDELPKSLGKIHVLPAEGVFDRAIHADDLEVALNANRGWLKQHTRLADQARQWLQQQKANGLLLRGEGLLNAERWQSAKPGSSIVSEQVMSLILASRQFANRRQKQWILGSLVIALTSIGMAAFAYLQSIQATQQRNEALLTQSRFLADLAEQELGSGNTDTSLALSLEALPSQYEHPRPFAPEAELVAYKSMLVS